MKLGKMIRFGNPLPWRLLRWTVAGGLLWSLVALAEAPPVKSRGRHGAAAMEDQLAELQKLQARRDLQRGADRFRPRDLGGLHPRRQQADLRAGRVGAEALLRHATLPRRLRGLRDLS